MTNQGITGLIIAAGKSGRMGEFKPLMDYNGKTFLMNIVVKLNPVCEHIIIVTGFNSDQLKQRTIENIELTDNSLKPKVEFVKNPDYEKGMFTSLKTGIGRAGGFDWVLYHFVDQPGLPPEFYTDFTGQIDNTHNWIQPSYDKKSGHPVLLKSDLFGVILEAGESSNLREINKSSVVVRKKWECYYKNVLQDIDTREDYIASIDPFS